jgi:hypothetical protein
MNDLEEHAPLALWIRGTDPALAALSRAIALVGGQTQHIHEGGEGGEGEIVHQHEPHPQLRPGRGT